MARYADQLDDWPGDDAPVRSDLDDPALIRAQLARMNEGQLRRLLVWLDQRGASAGKTFAVHQADPGDPASRDLIELQVAGFGAEFVPTQASSARAAGADRRARAGGARLRVSTRP